MVLKILTEIHLFNQETRTRGYEVALVKDQCTLDVRKYSFSQRTINEWNRLPADCVWSKQCEFV